MKTKTSERINTYVTAAVGLATLASIIWFGTEIPNHISMAKAKGESSRLYHTVMQVADLDGDPNTMSDSEWRGIRGTLERYCDSRALVKPYKK